MAIPLVFTAQGIQGGDWLILARLLREDGTTHNMVACVPADVTSITRTIVDLKDGATVLFTDSLTVSTAVLSALSTGSVWQIDSIGFNVRDQIPGSKLTDALGVEVQYLFVLTDGTSVPLAVQLDLKKTA